MKNHFHEPATRFRDSMWTLESQKRSVCQKIAIKLSDPLEKLAEAQL